MGDRRFCCRVFFPLPPSCPHCGPQPTRTPVLLETKDRRGFMKRVAAFLETVAEDQGRKLSTCITVVECSQRPPPCTKHPFPRPGCLCDRVLQQLQQVVDRQAELIPDAPFDKPNLRYSVRPLKLHALKDLCDATHPVEMNNAPAFPTIDISVHLDEVEEEQR